MLVAVDAFGQYCSRCIRLVEKTLRKKMDVPFEDFQFARQFQRVALCFGERHARSLGKRFWVEESRYRVDEALEDRLFVAGNTQQCLQYAGRVGVEAHDLALARPVLEMDPATSLKAGCQSPCQSPDNCVLIWAIHLKASLAVFVKFQADFLACELFEICSPLRPETRASYRIFSNLDRH